MALSSPLLITTSWVLSWSKGTWAGSFKVCLRADASPNQPSTHFHRAIPGTVLAYNKLVNFLPQTLPQTIVQ
ncbi:hypothetical protein HBI56_025190 [Parastagonospora nodorum]|nr:hypothetical protein HBH56_012860 [Parastagonospora nodorum]KAH4008496.1 hypothetical protein HBI13_234660 [Parastagonospora nodorum]KAH4075222.1 hypothetical protein HBH50_035770 [Parastagonospora nodorum]KAH4100509.1 hypothetical protein HBH46_148670 [Parastagonospora nodorum]KAH4120913.1 hypothetical protein HBH47_103750 [Parastagonospora nodorum]